MYQRLKLKKKKKKVNKLLITRRCLRCPSSGLSALWGWVSRLVRTIRGTQHSTLVSFVSSCFLSSDLINKVHIFFSVSGIKTVFKWLSRVWQYIVGECGLCLRCLLLAAHLYPPFPSRELIFSSETASRSRGVYSLCGWVAGMTGNESEKQRTLAGLQIFYRIITGLCSQMTCPQILHHQAFPPNSSGWLLSSEQLQVSLHKCWTFIWCCSFLLQSWHTKLKLSQNCWVFGSICPFYLGKLFAEGKVLSKKKLELE